MASPVAPKHRTWNPALPYGRNSMKFHNINEDGSSADTVTQKLKKIMMCFGGVVISPLICGLGLICSPCIWYDNERKKKMVPPGQYKAAGAGIQDMFFYVKPGISLSTKKKTEDVTDIVVSESMKDPSGTKINVVKPYSLRRSVDMTVQLWLRQSKFAPQIEAENMDKPSFFTHGPETGQPLDFVTLQELWCSQAFDSSQPANYCFGNRLAKAGSTWIPLDTTLDEDVVGYLYLLELPQSYYDTGKTMFILDCAKVSAEKGGTCQTGPEADGKIIARIGYGMAQKLGSHDKDFPDAYVFKGDVIRETGIKIAHTFRIVGHSKA